MEIKSVYAGLSSGLKRSASEEHNAMTLLKKSSLFQVVQNKIGSLQKLHNLMLHLPQKIKTEDIESEDSELSRLHGIIMDFVGSKAKAEDIVAQLHHRRILGICRTVGL